MKILKLTCCGLALLSVIYAAMMHISHLWHGLFYLAIFCVCVFIFLLLLAEDDTSNDSERVQCHQCGLFVSSENAKTIRCGLEDGQFCPHCSGLISNYNKTFHN